MKWLHSRALAATGDTGGNHWMAHGTAGGGGGAGQRWWQRYRA